MSDVYAAAFGGWFDSVAGAIGLKKPLEKKTGVKLTLKNPTPKQVASSVGTAVKVSAGAAALVIPGVNVAGAAAVAGGAVGADKLLAAASSVGSAAKDAKKTIDNTKKLAAAGNPDAMRGLETLASVAVQRRAKGTPAGVPQPITQAGQVAFDAFRQVVSKVVASPPKPAPRNTSAAKAQAAAARVARAKASQLAEALKAPGAVRSAKGGSTAAAKAFDRLKLDPGKVRWTVTDKGKVLRGSGRGWRVYTSGKVERAA